MRTISWKQRRSGFIVGGIAGFLVGLFVGAMLLLFAGSDPQSPPVAMAVLTMSTFSLALICALEPALARDFLRLIK